MQRKKTKKKHATRAPHHHTFLSVILIAAALAVGASLLATSASSLYSGSLVGPAAVPAALQLRTTPASANEGSCVNISIRVVNDAGRVISADRDIPFTLSDGDADGEFYGDRNCTAPPMRSPGSTIRRGTAMHDLKYKKPTAGVATTTVTAEGLRSDTKIITFLAAPNPITVTLSPNSPPASVTSTPGTPRTTIQPGTQQVVVGKWILRPELPRDTQISDIHFSLGTDFLPLPMQRQMVIADSARVLAQDGSIIFTTSTRGDRINRADPCGGMFRSPWGPLLHPLIIPASGTEVSLVLDILDRASLEQINNGVFNGSFQPGLCAFNRDLHNAWPSMNGHILRIAEE